MIVNSDEPMDLMDEGLNFMEYMAEQELELIFLLDAGPRILFLT
jgi:hypothetical protein